MSSNKNLPSSEKPLKVLIADDDAPTRILLRTAISQWGYEIVEAKDGEEAWNILQAENPPRLLILDWLMPKMDGITLCERCKSQFISNQPYIILLTQVSGTENIVKGIAAGADEFLSKPFNMAELRSRMSIGAKIVKYGNEILKKTNELRAYQKEIHKLANEISLITHPLSPHALTNITDPLLTDPIKLQECLDKINHIVNSILAINKEGS